MAFDAKMGMTYGYDACWIIMLKNEKQELSY